MPIIRQAPILPAPTSTADDLARRLGVDLRGLALLDAQTYAEIRRRAADAAGEAPGEGLSRGVISHEGGGGGGSPSE